MLQQMRTAFENSLAAVVEKSQERPAHHIPHPPPSHPFQNRHAPVTIATYLHLLFHNLPTIHGDPDPSAVVQYHQRLTSGLCQFIAVLHDAGYHPVTVVSPHGTSHLHVIVTDLVIDVTVADLSH